mmetsp:Transcript_27224/g.68598  ORF Transcript_27224/g.68598 Transcript_27224/m.68598 type:complete len:566 (+) Transcript_27224:108-1805(+)
MIRAIALTSAVGAAAAFAPTAPSLALAPSALCPSAAMCRPPSSRPALRPALGLRMSEETPESATLIADNAEKKEKRERALKLAEQARAALAEAEKAEQESAKYKGSAVRVSMGSELKAKSALSRMAEVTYSAWLKSFTGSPVQSILGDTEGLNTEAQKRERVKEAFERMDVDSSGGIDKAELSAALDAMGIDASAATVDGLFGEADVNGDKVIDFEEFYSVMTGLMVREEASSLEREMEAKAAAAAAANAPVVLEFDDVKASLEGVELVGAEEGVTASALEGLKGEQKLQRWDTYDFKIRDYSVERLTALTGIEKPDEQLGISVQGLVLKRVQATQFAGLSALICVFTAGLFPEPVQSVVRTYSYVAFMFNLIVPIFAMRIDGAIVDYELSQQADAADRWAYRQAGRFLATYLCGVPLAEVDYSQAGKPLLVPASKPSGNIDLAKARSGTNGTQNAFEAALAYGLTPKEVQKQAVIQTAGLMAESQKFGDATLGYQFLEELDRQIMLSQSFVDPLAKTFLARFGFVESTTMVRANKAILDELAEAVLEGKGAADLVAMVESHRKA